MSSEENTEKMPDARSFEERIFARLDAIDKRLAVLEAKQYDTKPIWERALAEIVGTRAEMNARFDNLERKIDVLNKDMLQLRADATGLDNRVAKLEESRA